MKLLRRSTPVGRILCCMKMPRIWRPTSSSDDMSYIHGSCRGNDHTSRIPLQAAKWTYTLNQHHVPDALSRVHQAESRRVGAQAWLQALTVLRGSGPICRCGSIAAALAPLSLEGRLDVPGGHSLARPRKLL